MLKKFYIDYLAQEVGLSKNSIVADVGAGTGILTKLLASEVRMVYAIEPNMIMRKACENHCSEYKNIITVDGCAEETTLTDSSVDFITAAQAFHWFDRQKAKIEFRSILKPNNKELERRCLFIENDKNEKIATRTIWWCYTGATQ